MEDENDNEMTFLKEDSDDDEDSFYNGDDESRAMMVDAFGKNSFQMNLYSAMLKKVVKAKKDIRKDIRPNSVLDAPSIFSPTANRLDNSSGANH